MKLTVLALLLAAASAHAISIVDYAKAHPIKTWIVTKGATMPNTTDQTNTLQEGDHVLLLSEKDIDDLTGLTTLTVEDEGKTVPITKLKNAHLFLNHNHIKSLPDDLDKLEGFHWVYFENNELSTLPPSLARMPSLEGMYYTSNRFTEIPPVVFTMTRLNKMQFSKNAIPTLPPEIGNLTELRHLNMSGNKLTVIPASIGKLTKLRVCDLSDNPIAVLPEEFGKVQIVNQLRVRNTLLTRLPAGFATMRATIDATGSQIDPATLSPELRAKLDTEKPPGSKPPEKIIVKKPEKKKAK
jgi:Leucine-rich repeat (LRR) protein